MIMSLSGNISSFAGLLRSIVLGVRSESVIRRHNLVHDLYDKILSGLGELGVYVSKGYIYDRIKDETGLSTRQIGRILNHTRKERLYGDDEKEKR